MSALRFRILKAIRENDPSASLMWDEVGSLPGRESAYATSTLAPNAATIGETFGEGSYLVIDTAPEYGGSWKVEEIAVVAVTTYEEAVGETEPDVEEVVS